MANGGSVNKNGGGSISASLHQQRVIGGIESGNGAKRGMWR